MTAVHDILSFIDCPAGSGKILSTAGLLLYYSGSGILNGADFYSPDASRSSSRLE